MIAYTSFLLDCMAHPTCTLDFPSFAIYRRNFLVAKEDLKWKLRLYLLTILSLSWTRFVFGIGTIIPKLIRNLYLQPTSISLLQIPYDPIGDSFSFLISHFSRSEVTVEGSYQAAIVVSFIIWENRMVVLISSVGLIESCLLDWFFSGSFEGIHLLCLMKSESDLSPSE